MHATVLLLLLAHRLLASAADCSCGYTINATSSTNHALFTEKLETNFLLQNPVAVTWSSQPGVDWVTQEYNTTPAAARGPYGKAAQLDNVILNPLPASSTGGQGVHGGDPGLQLWVRSQPVGGAGDQMVPIAEVVSARADILYGSFRVGMRTTAVNGTCGAFFFYHSDSQEIDMEILSRNQQPGVPQQQHLINLVNQSPDAVASGYNAVNTTGYRPYPLPFNPTQVYSEYRIDWLPDRIDMYADDLLLDSFRDYIPTAPGQLHLIHWSNGDPGWSGGPPAQDAVLTVSYVNAYFNTSSSSSQPPAACSGSGAANGICQISDQAPAQPTVPGSVSVTANATSTPTHSGSVVAGWPSNWFTVGMLIAWVSVYCYL